MSSKGTIPAVPSVLPADMPCQETLSATHSAADVSGEGAYKGSQFPANGSDNRGHSASVVLNRTGIHAFDYLPVIAFAIPPERAEILTG